MKKSLVLIIILITAFSITIFDILSRFNVAKQFENDAETINNLGKIRGAIQRLLKLETNNVERDDLIISIENYVNQFLFDSKNSPLVDNLKFNEIYQRWNKLKQEIYKYRELNNQEQREWLLLESEKIWDLADTIVNEAQFYSEIKLHKYRVLIVASCMNLILVILLIGFVKFYVHDKLERLVNKDALTNVYNRHYLNEALSNEFDKAERTTEEFSIIMFDIDNFKKVNDKFGHALGDYTLREVAKAAGRSIRKYDILARYGGEEFMIILPATNHEQAIIIAERIRHRIENLILKKVRQVTVSLGVATVQEEDTLIELQKRADTALYRAKKKGKNRVETVD
ncbi:diguanylate cyclase [Mobilitalea sibirica]|uniref:Diguanylate cyclase n=1 Tax=Mobilitalea sibirica TaxID=1462919 RepID=A0A8J7GX31_9FIRM|nr:diguanylate cyclase [Mobilitalea sibirica]MBH1939579.1 diguanylate cyclase [Mobilitalea sibirica]